MINKPSKNEKRQIRHLRVRKKVYGTSERPRLSVYRSEKHIYAQIINDDLANTLVSASSLDKELRDKISVGSNKEAAKAVGELIAKKALEKGIKQVVFDRSGYIYHGRVKELAEAARQAGLDF
ncbi:50S ribosomal protein L18 [Caloramator sp. E03]|uniref:50S ribosomal protein L18 n=1 Tax=Caloramator sp. E03 TaxID=2576307 RepID=UPI001110CA9F|nr:50S ribosomal protein L18 [Caloramator sp. E03]QCX33852.1 50S ribosomal protein L18 [Caloramator sp. E03]